MSNYKSLIDVPARIEKIRELRSEGKVLRVIAKELGISLSSLTNFNERHGVFTRTYRQIDETSQELHLGNLRKAYSALTETEKKQIRNEFALRRMTVAEMALTALLESLEDE